MNAERISNDRTTMAMLSETGLVVLCKGIRATVLAGYPPRSFSWLKPLTPSNSRLPPSIWNGCCGSGDVQSLLRSLTPPIEDAKAGRVIGPMDRSDIPDAWNVPDGRYISYDNPSVDGAYYDFAAEMRGGRTGEERQLAVHLEAMRKKLEGSQP